MAKTRRSIPPLLRWIQAAWTAVNESRLNINTLPRMERANESERRADPIVKFNDSRPYETPDYYYVFKILHLLKPGKEDIVYDIGAGMGRIVCAFSTHELQKCVGIEFSDALCQVARRNAETVRGRRTPIEIRCQDAATASLSDGTIYFLFNPFGLETMSRVVQNIKLSQIASPRRIRLVYCNSVHLGPLQTAGWLREYYLFRTFDGLEVRFFESMQ